MWRSGCGSVLMREIDRLGARCNDRGAAAWRDECKQRRQHAAGWRSCTTSDQFEVGELRAAPVYARICSRH